MLIGREWDLYTAKGMDVEDWHAMGRRLLTRGGQGYVRAHVHDEISPAG
jgi:hypothetical protein